MFLFKQIIFQAYWIFWISECKKCLIKLNLLHSVSPQSITICNLTYYDSAPKSLPLLTEQIYDVDVGSALNFVKVHY